MARPIKRQFQRHSVKLLPFPELSLLPSAPQWPRGSSLGIQGVPSAESPGAFLDFPLLTLKLALILLRRSFPEPFAKRKINKKFKSKKNQLNTLTVCLNHITLGEVRLTQERAIGKSYTHSSLGRNSPPRGPLRGSPGVSHEAEGERGTVGRHRGFRGRDR